MKRIAAVLIVLALALLCGCGEALPEETSVPETSATETTATTQDLAATEPNRPRAVMEPVQGGPMLYTFPGENGKLGLVNQDGELVAQPEYEPSNTWNYSAEYLVDVKYSYDKNGRVNGITLQKGAKGEEFVHYTLDGKSRSVKGFPENSERVFDRNEAQIDEETGTILSADKKPIYTAKPGEKIIALYPVPYESRMMGVVVQDAQGNVVKTFDNYGQPMQSKTKAQFFSDRFIFGGTVYQLKAGKWIMLDLRQFIKPVEEYCAVAGVVTENWVIVVVGVMYEGMDVEEMFAVDWNGKRIDDCPLEPFFDQIGITAGPQGPNYFWVETKDKRGYIDTQGNWLFVAP